MESIKCAFSGILYQISAFSGVHEITQLKLSRMKTGPDLNACLLLKINTSDGDSDSQESRIEEIVYIGQQIYEGLGERPPKERHSTKGNMAFLPRGYSFPKSFL